MAAMGTCWSVERIWNIGRGKGMLVVGLVLETYMPENNSTRNNFVSHSISTNIPEKTKSQS